ncbi:hypothetical protein [Duncaniella dubosii]
MKFQGIENRSGSHSGDIIVNRQTILYSALDDGQRLSLAIPYTSIFL